MPRRRAVAAVALLALFAASGCRFPQDAAGTLDRVEGGDLRVGVLEPADTIRLADDGAAGEDAALVAAIARRLGAARVVWIRGPDHALFADLEAGRIDLLVPVPVETLYEQRIALTREIGPTASPAGEKRALGTRRGENAFLLAVNRVLGDPPGAGT